MDFAKIRPRGGTKAQWEKANPVLAKREIGVQWETTIGVGEVVIKIGDGVTDWINLPEAVKSDITKKIIAALAVVPDDDPDLADGDSLDTLFGKIAKKFKYLKDNKLDKSARYDGTDSTSTELVPTANALRGVNAKADKNASDITTINNNLSKAIISSDLFADYLSPTFVRWNYKTANTPYKAGLTYGQEGFALVFGSVSGWHTVISWLKGGRNMWAHYVSEGTDYGWSEYAQKSDLTGLDATLSIREENGGVIVSFGSKDSKYGIYIGVGPNGVNANYKINGEWKKAIIIATKS